ncbi:MAG: NAD-dependent malic enzyme, mitochondrial [Watsoniomyces obsoletus]|nr:MAG: NAD-dependent malic enzyme, mitochondrial [Watsoniomyces obsoletus]
MGKKKRNHPDAEEILSRPWCYYCERDFDDLKILISHQKAKHYKCERCGRRLNTAGGLMVHMNQVHKETLTTVENALPNRAGPDIEIFGMEGIPEDIVVAHNQRVLSQFQLAAAERQAATGNPPPGGAGAAGPKKPKFESPAELKKRLAEHKAKLAEQATGGSSGGATPLGAHGMHGGSSNQGPSNMAGSPPFGQPSHAYGPPPSHGGYPPYSQPFEMSGSPYHHQPSFSPPPQAQHPHDYHHSGMPSYSGPQPYPPQQSYAPPGAPGFPTQYPGGPSPFGSGSPPPPFTQGHPPPPPRNMASPPNGPMPYRPGSLPPAASGLPQRPSFGLPPASPVTADPMHRGPTITPGGHAGGPPGVDQRGHDASGAPAANSAQDAANTAGEGDRTKVKKEKDKAAKLVYSDNEVSPEEKMAELSRYAFTLDKTGQTVLGDAIVPAVTGVVGDARAVQE